MAMTKSTIILSALMTFLLFASGPAWAQAKETRPAAKAITGPDAVDNQLDNDQDEKPNLLDANLLKSWEDWKADIADRSGLSFGLDYNALGLAATDSLGDETSASGVFRLFGTWNMIGRGTKNTGGIVFKVEHRHAYTDVAPSEFGSELGYAGVINAVFSDQGWRATHLHWRQGFSDRRGVAYTNGDATDLTGELDSFLDDFETFKSLEIGWTSSQPELFLMNNIHVTFWQIDERSEAGTSDGWGVAFSASGTVGEDWTPFIRGGWAEDGGSLYQAALAVQSLLVNGTLVVADGKLVTDAAPGQPIRRPVK